VGKKLGVGYALGILYSFNGYGRRFPVHFTMFPANRNDNPAFRATLGEFLPLKVGNVMKLRVLSRPLFGV